MKSPLKHYSTKLAAIGAIALVLTPYAAMAQLSAPPAPITSIYDPSGNRGILGKQSFLCNFFKFIFGLLIVVAIIFGLVAAYQYLMSQGDMEKLRNARNTLIYGAVAVVVGLIARGVPALVSNFFATGLSGSASGC